MTNLVFFYILAFILGRITAHCVTTLEAKVLAQRILNVLTDSCLVLLAISVVFSTWLLAAWPWQVALLLTGVALLFRAGMQSLLARKFQSDLGGQS